MPLLESSLECQRLVNITIYFIMKNSLMQNVGIVIIIDLNTETTAKRIASQLSLSFSLDFGIAIV